MLKNGDPLYQGLVKSGYKNRPPYMKYKALIIHFSFLFWLHTEKIIIIIIILNNLTPFFYHF
jgi:hypothetical protein